MPHREQLPDQSVVTSDMVERGAIGLWREYKRERVSATGKHTPLALQQGRSVSGWRDVAIKDWYRRRAAAVLRAALDEEQRDAS